MNKEYALKILSCIENKTLECDCSLAKEAYRYLLRLKSIQKDNELINKIHEAKYNAKQKFYSIKYY